ncbi:TPA: restriction endonuclease subunit S [Proteus mirabilis]|uniref:restriction endonuclease subunit S n=1 Tax=Gammaproteobacteria TaxID=1236 RepID=UPI0005AC96B0|nr:MULTISPECIES: restriction endonuclease subunit S [Gammaproteobacteria]EKW1743653.1 restriction endonuclease subunit S [Proteus mirabilis]HDI3134007.1 restriction endonuclease subunit S [Vibrio cholerae]KIP70246.1 restriction endonuclease [Vibrio alginolyticus]KIP82643.1 restriction endonuclease [Vibrio alginolyticus]MBO0177819.1 restriction endonuclease subunit S [Vibrio parahaemolyticus]
MSKKGKKALEPKLRFKRDDGSDFSSWSVKPLKEMAVRCTKKNGAEDVGRVLTNSASGGVVDQRDYFEKDIANKDNLGGYYIVEKDAYVYNPRISSLAPVGPISKNKVGKGVMSPLYTVFKFNDNNNDFYEYYFKSNQWHDYMRKVSNTGARYDRMNVTNDDFMSMPMPYPEKGERDKIADCLSSVDELIVAEEQKLADFKAHKKGLMQQLFSADGEVNPTVRFSNFQETGDWKKVELSELGELIPGLTYKPEDVREEGLLVLRSSNVQNGVISLQDNVYVRPDIAGANISKPNDILICVRNGSKSLIGKNALISSDVPLSTHGAFMTVFRTVHPKFVYQLFQTAAFEKQVAADLGATINSINGNRFKKYEFLIPPTSQEQEQIACFLSSVDELIENQALKVDQLLLHKKGLMQQLFPSMEEVGL